MATSTKKIKVRRLSQLPNRYGSYAYAVETPMTELKDVAGIYEGQNGPIVYSPLNIGDHNKSQSVEYRLVKERDGDRQFINLVDTSADVVGKLGSLAGQFKRAGLETLSLAQEAAKHLTANMFGNSQASQANQTSEQPEENPKRNPAKASQS